MFDKLRRRRAPAAASPAHPPVHVPAPSPEPGVADGNTLRRAEGLRAALHEAGLDLERLGPEPAWLADVRAGHSVTLGPQERTELVAYIGGVTAANVASDQQYEKVLRQIEAIPVLREMRDEGMIVHSCGEPLSAQALRAIQKAVRQAEREEQQEAPPVPLPPGGAPAEVAAIGAADWLQER
ncbi:hypothetical protein [Streptomyces sp. AC1-42T]|uniref:hypothetical protein n=1 Tax=Streptomyces sp. AC1-42T TaxID=2218665 RepID=UPI000DAE9F71|nr:hypothetical protein [Streptomyces sp. AC1-42T]PZT71556.1 hypothetical protein DNK55_33155 [Streptomyces sp. AC1-42T]